MYEYRNPQYTKEGDIDCQINHPELGWIDYTCKNNTREKEMQELWDALINEKIAPYIPPSDEESRAKWRPRASLTRTEFVLACKRAEILTTAESIEAAKGNWPDSFAKALEEPDVVLDPDEAQIIWAASTTIERLHPLISAIQSYTGMSKYALDDLFGYNS